MLRRRRRRKPYVPPRGGPTPPEEALREVSKAYEVYDRLPPSVRARLRECVYNVWLDPHVLGWSEAGIHTFIDRQLRRLAEAKTGTEPV